MQQGFAKVEEPEEPHVFDVNIAYASAEYRRVDSRDFAGDCRIRAADAFQLAAAYNVKVKVREFTSFWERHPIIPFVSANCGVREQGQFEGWTRAYGWRHGRWSLPAVAPDFAPWRSPGLRVAGAVAGGSRGRAVFGRNLSLLRYRQGL
jgi:hypothetical protein